MASVIQLFLSLRFVQLFFISFLISINYGGEANEYSHWIHSRVQRFELKEKFINWGRSYSIIPMKILSHSHVGSNITTTHLPIRRVARVNRDTYTVPYMRTGFFVLRQSRRLRSADSGREKKSRLSLCEPVMSRRWTKNLRIDDCHGVTWPVSRWWRGILRWTG